MHHPRPYSYDEQSHHPAYPGSAQSKPHPTSSGFPMHSQTSHQSHYQRQPGSPPYYVPPPPHISPPPAQGMRQYPHQAFNNSQTARVAETGYYQSSSMASSRAEYPSSTPYAQPPVNRDRQHGFIPTPSEIAQSYPNYTPESSSRVYQQFHPTSEPSPVGRNSTHHMGPDSSSTVVSNATSTTTSERYRCDKCDKTFSRSHDRKRHHETQHHPVPAIHRCRYCEKEFSRSDSLKRHLDNGCDEMRS